MSIKEVLNYLTVTGFQSNRSGAANSKGKTTRKKSALGNESVDKVSENELRLFRKEAAKKISVTEHKIADLKQKIESANSELARTYQVHINKLEFTKIGLLCQLEEYKSKKPTEWDAFKVEFNSELKSFEEELEDFVDNFMQK